jgi:hypothetical protein
MVTGVALSPDGSKLALAVQPNNLNEPNLQEIRVYTLATGVVRTWYANGTIGSEAMTPRPCPGLLTSGPWRSTGWGAQERGIPERRRAVD